MRSPARSLICLVALAGAARGQEFPAETLEPTGLRIWRFPGNDTGSFVVVALVGVGSRHESPDQTGIAHFLEHCLFRSTTERSTQVLIDQVREHEGSWNGVTTKDHTAYFLSVPSEHWEFAVGWISEIVTRPALLEAEVDAERRIVYEEVRERSPHISSPTVEGNLFAGHPLSRSVGGDRDRFDRIGPADLRSFHAAHYRAGNVVVAFSGRVPQARCTEAIRQGFADLGTGAVPPAEVPDPLRGTRFFGSTDSLHEVGAVEEGILVAGYHIRPRTPAHFAACLVLRQVLEDRFFDEVRTKRYLAYHPDVAFEFFTDAWRMEFLVQISDVRRLPALEEAFDEVIGSLPRMEATPFRLARSRVLDGVSVSTSDGLLECAVMTRTLRANGAPDADLLRELTALDQAAATRIAATVFTRESRYLLSNSRQLVVTGKPELVLTLALLAVALIGAEAWFGFRHARSSIALLRSVFRRRRRRRRKKAAPMSADVDSLEGEIQAFFESEEEQKRSGP